MILLFGLPGSGKTSQAKLLASTLGWTVVDAGELLRQQADPEVMQQMQAGHLVTPAKVDAVIDQALRQIDDLGRVVLDGYPREVEQAQWLVGRTPAGVSTIGAVFVLDVSSDALAKRLWDRGRQDDTPQAIIERFKEQAAVLRPTTNYFASLGVPIIHIDSSQDIPVVQAQIMNHLKELGLV